MNKNLKSVLLTNPFPRFFVAGKSVYLYTAARKVLSKVPLGAILTHIPRKQRRRYSTGDHYVIATGEKRCMDCRALFDLLETNSNEEFSFFKHKRGYATNCYSGRLVTISETGAVGLFSNVEAGEALVVTRQDITKYIVKKCYGIEL